MPPCVQHTPLFCLDWRIPHWLHRFSFAACVTQTPPFTTSWYPTPSLKKLRCFTSTFFAPFVMQTFSHFVIYLVSSLSQNTSLVDCYIISRSSPTHCALHYYGSSMTKAQRHVGVPRWLTECCWYHRSFMVQPYIIPIYQRFSSNHSSIKPHTMFSIITFSSSSSSSLVRSNINNDYTTQIKSRIVSTCWQSLAMTSFPAKLRVYSKAFHEPIRSPPSSCMLSASPFTSPRLFKP